MFSSSKHVFQNQNQLLTVAMSEIMYSLRQIQGSVSISVQIGAQEGKPFIFHEFSFTVLLMAWFVVSMVCGGGAYKIFFFFHGTVTSFSCTYHLHPSSVLLLRQRNILHLSPLSVPTCDDQISSFYIPSIFFASPSIFTTVVPLKKIDQVENHLLG